MAQTENNTELIQAGSHIVAESLIQAEGLRQLF